MIAISVRSLCKDYGTQRVVDDISFDVPYGAVTGFVGANGSGKTTTMRAMLGLIEPTSGHTVFHDSSYAALPDPRRSVGAVVDRIGAHPSHTARQHLMMIALASGVPRSRVADCLAQVGLGEVGDKRLSQYSMGMMQRCALAAALLGSPPILMLDEPANGLDPGGIRWLREQMRGWADDGRAVLVSTHQLAELAVIVDRLVVIDRGSLAFAGPIQELNLTSRTLEEAVFELIAARSDSALGPNRVLR